MQRVRRHRSWVVGLVGLVLVAGGAAIWRVEVGSGIYTSGLSLAKPSPIQLRAMGAWYQRNYAPEFFAGFPGRFGCGVYSIATRQLPAGQSMAYTEVVCEQCSSLLGGETPAVFHLDGAEVLGVQADQAQGDPGFFDEIEQYFPRQLWDEAEGENIPKLYVAAAYHAAGCDG